MAAVSRIFLLLLLAAAVAYAQGVATRNAPAAPRGAPPGRPFGAFFEDIAAKAGLTEPVTVGNPETKKYIIEANGTGMAAIDFDNDGWLDLFVVSSSRLEGFGKTSPPTNRLYRNTGNGTF